MGQCSSNTNRKVVGPGNDASQTKGGNAHKSGTVKPTQSIDSSSDVSIDMQLSQSDNRKSDVRDEYFVAQEVKGYGVTSQVRQAIHRETQKVFAVKTMTKANLQREDRMRREVAYLKEMDHPNIIRAHDVFEDDSFVHIVTDMCCGGELFDKILDQMRLKGEVQCFSERFTINIIRSLLSAVLYLHQRDIVHRDLKPENILFSTTDENSPVKLIDFGLAIRHKKDQKPLTSRVGTVYYMAPELLEGSYDRACDLWSVGVIAYLMIAGRPPFNGEDDDVMFEKIRRGDPPVFLGKAWINVSDFAKHFIKCLICHDRSKRWTADMALQHPWLKTA